MPSTPLHLAQMHTLPVHTVPCAGGYARGWVHLGAMAARSVCACRSLGRRTAPRGHAGPGGTHGAEKHAGGNTRGARKYTERVETHSRPEGTRKAGEEGGRNSQSCKTTKQQRRCTPRRAPDARRTLQAAARAVPPVAPSRARALRRSATYFAGRSSHGAAPNKSREPSWGRAPARREPGRRGGGAESRARGGAPQPPAQRPAPHPAVPHPVRLGPRRSPRSRSERGRGASARGKRRARAYRGASRRTPRPAGSLRSVRTLRRRRETRRQRPAGPPSPLSLLLLFPLPPTGARPRAPPPLLEPPPRPPAPRAVASAQPCAPIAFTPFRRSPPVTPLHPSTCIAPLAAPPSTQRLSAKPPPPKEKKHQAVQCYSFLTPFSPFFANAALGR